jgi:hypothetical protein
MPPKQRRNPGTCARVTSTTPIAANQSNGHPWPADIPGDLHCERPSHTAVAVWVDIATAPWFGSCTSCGRELDNEPIASDGCGWLCVQCLTETVRAHVIRELGRCA